MNKRSCLTLAMILVLLCSCSSKTDENSGSVPFPMPPEGETAILVTDEDVASESAKGNDDAENDDTETLNENTVSANEAADATPENVGTATQENNSGENKENTDKDKGNETESDASEVPGNTASENKQPEANAEPDDKEPEAVKNGEAEQSPSSSVSEGDWNLILVNPWNELPAGFTVERTTLKNGHSIDKRAYPDLQSMMDDMRAEGLSPIICSSYRTLEKQTTLYNNKVNKLVATGLSRADSETEAAKWVAVPGTSEHHTGLALDIVAESYQLLDEAQEKTAEQKWLMKNSYKYGFILRYPNDKTAITGIYYEPWHYRYVGKTAAKEIFESGLTLEEYLQKR